MESPLNLRVAMLSLHSCPLDVPGRRDTGGMNVYVQQLARGLGRRGINVDVFTCAHSCPGTGDVLEEDVRLVHLPVAYHGGKLGLYGHLPRLTRAMIQFAREEGINYHLVHSHYWLSGLAGKELAEQWRVPHITMLHTSARAKNHYLRPGAESELRERAEEDILSAADLVVASTIREKADLQKMYGVPEGKIAVIPCGVDLEMFRPCARSMARRELGLNGEPLVLYVGRIEPGKGIELLLEALALFSPGRPGLMIVGGDEQDRPEVDKLRYLSRRLGVANRVAFWDAVAQSRLPFFYSAADVYVLPSSYETFGMAALECLACGTPVIASRVGAMEDIIQPGINGFLLDTLSARAIASYGRLVLEDTNLRQKMSGATRGAVTGYSWQDITGRIIREYGKIMKN